MELHKSNRGRSRIYFIVERTYEKADGQQISTLATYCILGFLREQSSCDETYSNGNLTFVSNFLHMSYHLNMHHLDCLASSRKKLR